jgi:hypothetical protein
MVLEEEAMRGRIRCAHCSCLFFPDPRVKNQRYCSSKECQRARKRLWQKEKLAHDPITDKTGGIPMSSGAAAIPITGRTIA